MSGSPRAVVRVFDPDSGALKDGPKPFASVPDAVMYARTRLPQEIGDRVVIFCASPTAEERTEIEASAYELRTEPDGKAGA